MARNDGRLELLTDKNSVLVLLDYQPTMFKSVASGDKVRIKKAAICAAKAASILGIPVVLSSINPKHNGDFIPEITKLFPDQEVFARKMPSLTPLKMKGPGMRSKRQSERSWSSLDCGLACASLTPLCML